MFERILIVCVGNICRSPTAEYVLRHRLGDRARIGSAGLSAMVGYPVEPTALALLREHGIDGEAHRARQLDARLLRESDLVLAMERSHVDTIRRLAPESSGKVSMMDRWLGGKGIPDPYRQQRRAFEHVYELIDESVNSWLPYL
ncbi:low molecular weight phosphotyrosine protein phosphatase [Luteibacter aegosomatis]|uniref:low molecular weight protein-tyrosine-phosphatase n=1 Tax=Luteibacter aegosomatis TaxID=2911537 RepID=UPI001FF8DE62|nr:low molecular weight protein-tyrosine-phosphatase [Luteibacter aegosomatis]UPG87764.1 low molecular weight phosphotyrosine protein phosphatase [Luteibacter aegosomatis]